MTKYSTELKIEIVSKYLNHEDSIKGLAKHLKDYIYWFNNVRRSNKLKYTTPVKYRNRVLSNL